MDIRLISRGEGDICKRYKPHTFDEVVGQYSIVESLRNAVISHNSAQCYLFHGESGCGKSTLAFIVAMSLNCKDLNKNGNPCCECSNCVSIMKGSFPDYKEINAAEATGIDKVRTLIEELKLTPMVGRVKIYVLNEAHGMSAKAQDALLQEMDKMPKGAYIILTSTEASKIRGPLKNRCETYRFNKLTKPKIRDLIDYVFALEGGIASSIIKETIANKSECRPRNALKLLQVAINIGVGDEKSIIEAIDTENAIEAGIADLCRLVQRKNSTWPQVVKTYKDLSMPAESTYYIMGSWFRSSLEKSSGAWLSKSYKALGFFIDDLPSVKPESKLVHSIYGAWKSYRE